ncbi:class I SAM-dependent methyltransferase [Myxococcus sp. K15C18031901]|uniref:class I SAM-dependent methyltransferase n=1 Tax=Myxococcus dinghuensis TaxID=2906761 RepID=UPI0020A734D0|nr:methyltransferase domain-containing protein [Myxococcus dinghuensis]MCP3105084.1 class I SAM-dependent methyltransferase [Myxococcus dinghuensis]
MSRYRDNILELMAGLLSDVPVVDRALDFGAGDGWFAQAVTRRGWAREVVPVDVQRREHGLVDPVLYDGQHLPFPDRSFPLTYSIDVVHHAPDPVATLEEVLRCTGEYFLLKDHTYRGRFGYLTLCVLDELGNRRFGVPSRYRYQHEWSWMPVLERAGFALQKFIHPAECERGPSEC